MASSRTIAPPLLLQLSEADNVAVAVRPLQAGMQAGDLTVSEDVPMGHKIALRAIAGGEKIFKWGMPIGSATRAIATGEHVHTHNMRSDYLPTFTLEGSRRFLEQSP